MVKDDTARLHADTSEHKKFASVSTTLQEAVQVAMFSDAKFSPILGSGGRNITPCSIMKHINNTAITTSKSSLRILVVPTAQSCVQQRC